MGVDFEIGTYRRWERFLTRFRPSLAFLKTAAWMGWRSLSTLRTVCFQTQNLRRHFLHHLKNPSKGWNRWKQRLAQRDRNQTNIRGAWALPMWFSKYWDFAKMGISRIFMDFRALFWGFQMPAGTWNPYILPEIPIFAWNPKKCAKSQF